MAFFILQRLGDMCPFIRNHSARPLALGCFLLARWVCGELPTSGFLDQFDRLRLTYTRLSLERAGEIMRTLLRLLRWSIPDITRALFCPAGADSPLACTVFEEHVERVFSLANVQACFEGGPDAEQVSTPQLVPLLLSVPSQNGLYRG